MDLDVTRLSPEAAGTPEQLARAHALLHGVVTEALENPVEPVRPLFQALHVALEGTGRATLQLPEDPDHFEPFLRTLLTLRRVCVDIREPETAALCHTLLLALADERDRLRGARRQSALNWFEDEPVDARALVRALCRELELEHGIPPREPGDEDWTPGNPPLSAPRRRSWWGRARRALGLGE